MIGIHCVPAVIGIHCDHENCDTWQRAESADPARQQAHGIRRRQTDRELRRSEGGEMNEQSMSNQPDFNRELPIGQIVIRYFLNDGGEPIVVVDLPDTGDVPVLAQLGMVAFANDEILHGGNEA